MESDPETVEGGIPPEESPDGTSEQPTGLDGNEVASPLSSAGRIVVEDGRRAPYAGYWIDTTRDFVQYFKQGERLPHGRWTFVTAQWNLPRTQLRALIEELGLFVGDISELKFA